MIIREANISDALAIAKVNVDTWRTAYRGIVPDEHLAKLAYPDREKFVVDFLKKKDDKTFIFVAEKEPDQIVGYAAGGPERSGNALFQGEIYAIYIFQGYQHQGIGQLLIKEVVKKLNQVGINSMLIWVLAESPYRRFYEKLGGKQIELKNIEVDGFRADLIAYGWVNTAVMTFASKCSNP